MKVQPWESNVMLAGLTRGIWMDAPADHCQEYRGTPAGASSRRGQPVYAAETPDLTSGDSATGSTGSTSDHG